uniref:Uncharacterized protein n=1 Tax=Arundo donax TaxID=35708 RepID=A0A0A9MGP1_ARUDO
MYINKHKLWELSLAHLFGFNFKKYTQLVTKHLLLEAEIHTIINIRGKSFKFSH